MSESKPRERESKPTGETTSEKGFSFFRASRKVKENKHFFLFFFFKVEGDTPKKNISMKRFSDAAHAAAHGASRHKSSSMSLSSRVCDLLKVRKQAEG